MATTIDIQEHMPVFSSERIEVGLVDHMEGEDRIKLTKNGPGADGVHHFIPVAWVDHVDTHVHLNKTAEEVRRDWQSEA